jgi:UDP-2,3-diacylglucosamine pyrophosphatase LpxH
MISSDDPRNPLVIIADAHISRRQGNADAFLEMLAALEKGVGDVVFLGDIFDLWIALPRYENDLHRTFLSWCRKQKPRRRIGFIEGNHEFFLARRHAAAFTWCTQLAWWKDSEGNLFCHGDRINRHDRNYLTFRKLTKNPITRTAIHCLPMGPKLVNHVKRRLKGTNRAFRKSLPKVQLRKFAEERFQEGATRIFLGHFHQSYFYRGAHGGQLHTLPDWYSRGWISVLSADRHALRQGPWRDMLSIPE